MSVPDLTSRAATTVSTIAATLSVDATRWTVVVASALVAVVGHAWLADPRLAWISAGAVLAAGLGGTTDEALTVAGTVAAAHVVADLIVGLSANEILGVAVRSAALPVIALFAATLAHVERLRAAAQERSATEDSVTGLTNVRAFYDELERLVHAATPHAVVVLDVAGMHRLNDRWGHPMGTEAVRTLGHVLRRTVGDRALIGRLGSDEVAVVLVATDRVSAEEAARGILHEVEDEVIHLPDGSTLRLVIHSGVAVFPEDAEDEVALLREAQRRLESSKDRSRGSTRVVTDG